MFRLSAKSRRVLSGLCAAVILVTISFSSAFVSVEADHDCAGRDCPICLELQNCVANFQLLGSSASPGEEPLPAVSIFAVETVPRTHRAPATTLRTLDVRFDE